MSSPTAPNLSITAALKHPPTLSTVAPYLRCFFCSLRRAAVPGTSADSALRAAAVSGVVTATSTHRWRPGDRQ
eukprot:6391846-Prymnesium_polylepis.1